MMPTEILEHIAFSPASPTECIMNLSINERVVSLIFKIIIKGSPHDHSLKTQITTKAEILTILLEI